MNLRTYGKKPYRVALVHGGPGAAGSMKPVCEALAGYVGVLEPLQTKNTIEGQLLELKSVLEAHTSEPVVLMGHSWGAMLSYMFAATYPQMVKKLIMVASGNLEHRYVEAMNKRRAEKSKQLPAGDAQALHDLQAALSNPNENDKHTLFAAYGALMDQLDSYDPIHSPTDTSRYDYDIFRTIWSEASMLRNSGELLAMGKHITCKVVVIHGTHDAHPAHGIEASLRRVLEDFTFVLLEKCGHTPWLEKQAKETFYEVMIEEIEDIR